MEWIQKGNKYILDIGDLRFFLYKYGEYWKIDLQVKSYGKEKENFIYRPSANLICFKDEQPLKFATEYLENHIFTPIKSVSQI